MLMALKTSIERQNLTIKKISYGSIAILFSNGKKPFVLNSDAETNLSQLYKKEDLLKSNVESLVRKGVIKIVICD